MRPIVVYALWRAALFLVPFAIIVAVGWEWYLALVIALVFAFCASYIFLRRQRYAATEAMASMREGRRPADDRADEDVEDEVLGVDGSAHDDHGAAAEADATASADRDPSADATDDAADRRDDR